jgi:hypothetical protein
MRVLVVNRLLFLLNMRINNTSIKWLTWKSVRASIALAVIPKVTCPEAKRKFINLENDLIHLLAVSFLLENRSAVDEGTFTGRYVWILCCAKAS